MRVNADFLHFMKNGVGGRRARAIIIKGNGEATARTKEREKARERRWT